MDRSILSTVIKKCKKGDRKAFKVLFDYFQQALFNYLVYKSNDIALAEDLLQETFLKLWETRKQLDENQSVKSYLYKIAHNLFLNDIRHRKIIDKHNKEMPDGIFIMLDDILFLLEPLSLDIRNKDRVIIHARQF